jgi:hypothetical protein
MDSKYVRKTVENLLAELEKNPAIGRRPSPSFMSRYGRPLGLGIALSASGALGCSGSSEESKNPDALPASKDAVPEAVAVYGTDVGKGIDTKDALPPPVDVYGTTDVGQPIDTRDALPGRVDAYGVADVPFVQKDAADAGSPDLLADTRDALPKDVAVYGVDLGRGLDSKDALPPPVDVYGTDVGQAVDTPDAQPQSPEVSREVQAE